MSDQVLEFVRDVTKEEWHPLPHDMKAGDKIIRYSGHTYGLDRDDAMLGGWETIACCLPETPDGPFFTVQVEYLKDGKGQQPCGAYIPRAKLQAAIAEIKAKREGK